MVGLSILYFLIFRYCSLPFKLFDGENFFGG